MLPPELPWPESQPRRPAAPDLVAMLLRPDWVDDDDRLAQAWWAFHLAHISVGRRLHSMTVELVDQGHTRLSIGMLWEVLRHETMLGHRSTSFPNLTEFRLNNNHRALYARWLMDLDTRLAGVFETRARNRTDEWNRQAETMIRHQEAVEAAAAEQADPL